MFLKCVQSLVALNCLFESICSTVPDKQTLNASKYGESTYSNSYLKVCSNLARRSSVQLTKELIIIDVFTKNSKPHQIAIAMQRIG